MKRIQSELKRLIFISDLHLSAAEEEKTDIFLRFLQRLGTRDTALFILGDLFDYWIGDDDLNNPLHQSITKALARVGHSGIPVYIMGGNRDFLIGKELSRLTGTILLDEYTEIDIFGVKTLLCHGDQFCTEDVEYQQIREQVRTDEWKRRFMELPIQERHKKAKRYRNLSESKKEYKSQEIMDVSNDAVESEFRKRGCHRIIHGHTHRHARHQHTIDNTVCERFVLSDWDKKGQSLTFTETGYVDHFFD